MARVRRDAQLDPYTEKETVVDDSSHRSTHVRDPYNIV
jgi:hypothetical protein